MQYGHKQTDAAERRDQDNEGDVSKRNDDGSRRTSLFPQATHALHVEVMALASPIFLVLCWAYITIRSASKRRAEVRDGR
jgi:hypothetical protein